MGVQELEKAVAVLSPEEPREFRARFADFDMAQWAPPEAYSVPLIPLLPSAGVPSLI